MEQLSILIVDDNHINRLYLRTILTQWQHRVIEAEDGQAAITACKSQDFDWILMDIRMQPMDGITASQTIKKLANYRHIPITAVSAEPIEPQSVHYFNECLIKPVSKKDLKRILDEMSGLNRTVGNNIFDEQQALAIAHQDPNIVNHLRGLLAADLPSQLTKIEHLQQQQEWQKLDDQLHHLLGSVRVCAAINLEQFINNYRLDIAKSNWQNTDQHLTALHQAGELLIKYVEEMESS